MTIYRLAWTQLGMTHCQDFKDEAVAQDALTILRSNYSVKDAAVSVLPPGEPFDLRGPRLLNGQVSGSIQDQAAWTQSRGRGWK